MKTRYLFLPPAVFLVSSLMADEAVSPPAAAGFPASEFRQELSAQQAIIGGIRRALQAESGLAAAAQRLLDSRTVSGMGR
jgi:hypothetical protein